MFASSNKTLYLCGEFQKCVDSAPKMQFKNYVSIIIFENAWGRMLLLHWRNLANS